MRTEGIGVLLRDVNLPLLRLALTHLEGRQAFFLLGSRIDVELVSAKGIDWKLGSDWLLLVHPDELHLADEQGLWLVGTFDERQIDVASDRTQVEAVEGSSRAVPYLVFGTVPQQISHACRCVAFVVKVEQGNGFVVHGAPHELRLEAPDEAVASLE